MNKDWNKHVKQLYSIIELERSAVGLKLIKTLEEYEQIEAITLQKPINYCQMVKGASKGHIIKANNNSFACKSASRALGLDIKDINNKNGENWLKLGLYKDAELSKAVRDNLIYSTNKIYGVLVSPIERLEIEPDVIVIVTDPYNCMRIIQGYAYHFGMPKSINMIGNQAICVESSARPYISKDINISLLCIGTRHKAHWGNHEMAVGIPKEQFPFVVDGILKTVNIMEDNKNKQKIEKKMKNENLEINMRYNYNYYMDC